MAETVIQYVLRRLNEIGVDDIFGVASDYAFPVNDAIVEHPSINWIGCCNELNAAYAADGYARMRGVGAVCTTYGVGELAAMSGVAGSYAENLAVFHLVGTPNLPTQERQALVHHTLGNGEFDLFSGMAESVVCASATMTPQNAAAETERLIVEALYHRRPVYMAFPSDVANMPVAHPTTFRRWVTAPAPSARATGRGRRRSRCRRGAIDQCVGQPRRYSLRNWLH
jgi:indolepyruvate decarboxylase